MLMKAPSVFEAVELLEAFQKMEWIYQMKVLPSVWVSLVYGIYGSYKLCY